MSKCKQIFYLLFYVSHGHVLKSATFSMKISVKKIVGPNLNLNFSLIILYGYLKLIMFWKHWKKHLIQNLSSDSPPRRYRAGFLVLTRVFCFSRFFLLPMSFSSPSLLLPALTRFRNTLASFACALVCIIRCFIL